MSLLIIGVLMFTLVHLIPAVMRPARDQWAERLGANRYQGLFALVIVGSIVVIVFGWKSAIPSPVYAPPLGPGIVTSTLILVASILFVASTPPTNIKRLIRHPQMVGTLIWSASHLLSNGDSRSLILFGGLGLWSIAEMVFCSKRDGKWQKPPTRGVGFDIASVVAGLLFFAIFAYFHPSLFGVAATVGL